ncbi:hypothetical protein DLM75_09510 [Leptospira stimsonii]|uniref:Uncharacterized protein n=1 Tax=Leptospira stimsonii TaxID=2202203 RepID=A0A396Z9Z6_9LEPT|nr:hypothetical protein DLM75_09510 [Leptospira stimsonii]
MISKKNCFGNLSFSLKRKIWNQIPLRSFGKAETFLHSDYHMFSERMGNEARCTDVPLKKGKMNYSLSPNARFMTD